MLYAFDFNYAGLIIDAAQGDDGQVWISTHTIALILETSTDRRIGEVFASKSFKAFAGEGFELVKLSSKTTKANARANFYSKESFLKLLYYFCSYVPNGNSTPQMLLSSQKVKNLVFSGFVADFEGSIQNAIGNQLSEEEREYLRQLVFNRLQAFRAWTSIIRDRYLEFYGEKPEGWYYGKLIKEANLYLFGVENFGSDRTENMTTEQQKLILEFESMLARQAKKHPHFDPEALMRHTLNVCF